MAAIVFQEKIGYRTRSQCGRSMHIDADLMARSSLKFGEILIVQQSEALIFADKNFENAPCMGAIKSAGFIEPPFRLREEL